MKRSNLQRSLSPFKFFDYCHYPEALSRKTIQFNDEMTYSM